MALKVDLEGRLSDCKSASDFTMLAVEASKEPADLDFAKELVEKAENMCGLPVDYIKTAEAYFLVFNDKEKAKELYEEAADNCFEAIESAELGHSLFKILGDKEKAKEHLDNAAKEAKKVDELMTISGYFLSDLGDEDTAKELMSKVESELKTYDDFLKTCETLLAQGDKETAASIFKKALNKVDGIDNTVEYARTIKKLFDDDDWAKETLEDIVDDAQFTKEFVTLAAMYNELGDEEKCDELIEQGQDFAMQGDEHIILAKAYMNIKKNTEKARESFEKGMKDISDKTQLINFAKDIATEMKDKVLAMKFFQQAELKVVALKDYLNLAAEVKSSINDVDYIDGLYDKAEEKSESFEDLKTLAGDILANLQITEKATAVYNKALEAVQKIPQYFELLEETFEKLKNKEFARKILDYAFAKAETSPELILIAKAVIKYIEDKEYAKEILVKAEEIVTTLDELKEVDVIVKEYFADDAEWLKRLVEKLEKREKNQAVYDEFQQREKGIKTFKELLELNKDMMAALDDFYYSKKLLTMVETMLIDEFFNFDKYKKLIEAIHIYLKDDEWIKSIIETVYASRVQFIFELEAVCLAALNYLSDERQAQNLVLKFTDDFEKKIDDSTDKDANDYIKLAGLVFELLADKDNAKSMLAKAAQVTSDANTTGSIALGYFKMGDGNNADFYADKALGICKSSEDVFSLIQILISKGYDRNKAKALYLKGKEKTGEGADIIGWVAGLIDLFGDYELAEQEYKSAANKLSRADKELLEISRRAYLEKDIF